MLVHPHMFSCNTINLNAHRIYVGTFQVIRSATARSGPGLNGITQGGGSGLKEMHYVLRVLTPAACRAPALFSDITRSILRIQLPPPAKRGMHGYPGQKCCVPGVPFMLALG